MTKIQKMSQKHDSCLPYLQPRTDLTAYLPALCCNILHFSIHYVASHYCSHFINENGTCDGNYVELAFHTVEYALLAWLIFQRMFSTHQDPFTAWLMLPIVVGWACYFPFSNDLSYENKGLMNDDFYDYSPMNMLRATVFFTVLAPLVWQVRDLNVAIALAAFKFIPAVFILQLRLNVNSSILVGEFANILLFLLFSGNRSSIGDSIRYWKEQKIVAHGHRIDSHIVARRFSS